MMRGDVLLNFHFQAKENLLCLYPTFLCSDSSPGFMTLKLLKNDFKRIVIPNSFRDLSLIDSESSSE